MFDKRHTRTTPDSSSIETERDGKIQKDVAMDTTMVVTGPSAASPAASVRPMAVATITPSIGSRTTRSASATPTAACAQMAQWVCVSAATAGVKPSPNRPARPAAVTLTTES